MRTYTLNIELISNKKFSEEELEMIKKDISMNEDYIEFYDILLNFITLNYNKYIEISIEDLEIEYDISSYALEMIKSLDKTIKNGLSNDSKFEYTDNESMITIIYKNNNNWVEKITDIEKSIYEKRWDDDDFYNSIGGYND